MRNAAVAEDLVQDTYLKAFRARTRFEPGTNLKAWIFTILQNTWRNRQREAARARVDDDSETVEQAAEGHRAMAAMLAESPETLLIKDALDADLRSALAALPAAFREAVWLRDVEGLAHQEIAGALDIPIGTVMSRISRGRNQLHDRPSRCEITRLRDPCEVLASNAIEAGLKSRPPKPDRVGAKRGGRDFSPAEGRFEWVRTRRAGLQSRRRTIRMEKLQRRN